MGALGAFVAIVVTITLIGRGTPWAALAGAALVVWCAYFYRLVQLSVVVRADALTVRNLARTRQLRPSAVRALSLEESRVAKSPNQTVVLHLVDGQAVALDACARSTQSRRPRRRVEDSYRYLSGWAASASPAGGSSWEGG